MSDRDELRRMDGLHVGSLTDEELEIFERAVAEKRAHRSYEGGSGFMGLAKVRLVWVPA